MRVVLFAVVSLCSAVYAARGQTFLGGGLAGTLPTTQLAPVTQFGLQGFAQYGVHRYCNVWPMFSLGYTRMFEENGLTVLDPYWNDAVAVQAHVRWFPWGSTTLPLYGALGTGLSVIVGNDDEGVVGMPGSLEVGYLFNYANPCCDWFIDVQLRYTAMNMLRDLDRPHLSGLSAAVSINFPLGGKK